MNANRNELLTLLAELSEADRDAPDAEHVWAQREDGDRACECERTDEDHVEMRQQERAGDPNEQWDAQIATKLGADEYLLKFPKPEALSELISNLLPVTAR